MAAINAIAISTGYRTAEGKHYITVEMERKKVAYILIALENLRFGKIDTVLLKDATLPVSGKLRKDGKGYALSFMGKAIPLSEEHISQILSLLLDVLNGTKGVGEPFRFAQENLSLSVVIGE